MYVSPLIDARGRQTGWMSSVTNITEAKRVRDQLSAAHERFTTVLEGLDAAVSVVSVQRGEGLVVGFVVADCAQAVAVEYEGILPDLFREGQGIVAMGRWQTEAGGRFIADEVLAKHDENYMPPDLAEAMMSETGHACEPFKSAMEVSAVRRDAGAVNDR